MSHRYGALPPRALMTDCAVENCYERIPLGRKYCSKHRPEEPKEPYIPTDLGKWARNLERKRIRQAVKDALNQNK
jgi:hypothetical protein